MTGVTPDQVHRHIVEILPDLPDDPTINLLESQLIDSYSIIEIVDLLEQTFSVRFGPTDLSFDNLITLTAMAETVNRLRNPA
jgi:acyl carrier protein